MAINPQTSGKVGPGAYNLGMGNSSKNVKKNLGFTTDERSGVGGRSFAPGPGQYDTRGNCEIENGHIFGTSKRKDEKDLMRNPGPGQYDARSSIKDGGASMKARHANGGFI